MSLRESAGVCYARVARAHGVELPPGRLDDAFQRVFAGMPAMAFPGVAADEIALHERAWWRDVVRSTFLATDSSVRFSDFDAVFDGLFEHFGSGAAWQLRAGAEACLATLAERGLALGVVSNFDQRLPNILQDLGIMKFFDVVMLPSRCACTKPDPAIFAAALAAIDVEAAAAFFVGDHAEIDLAGGRAAGLRTLDVAELTTLAELPTRLEALATLPR